MKTWNAELKQHWVDEMQAHQDADRLRSGDFWDGEKGCFFGCAMQSSDSTLEKAIEAMELPSWLVYLAEAIFENLDEGSEEQLNFPVELCKAIPVDADIDKVNHLIAIDRLTPLAHKHISVRAAIERVIRLHKKALTCRVSDDDWSAARSAAYSAADSAAYSAADSAAWTAEKNGLIKHLKAGV